MCANRGSPVPVAKEAEKSNVMQTGKSREQQRIADHFIMNPVVEVVAPAPTELPWYRCHDCGLLQTAASPHADECEGVQRITELNKKSFSF